MQFDFKPTARCTEYITRRSKMQFDFKPTARLHGCTIARLLGCTVARSTLCNVHCTNYIQFGFDSRVLNANLICVNRLK